MIANTTSIKHYGNYSEYTVQVFPGVQLDYYVCNGGFNSLHSVHTGMQIVRNDFMLFHCKQGRFEADLTNGLYRSRGAGQMTMSTSLCTLKESAITSQLYESISITLTQQLFPHYIHSLFADWHIDISELITHFGIAKNWYCIDSGQKQIEKLFLDLYDLFEAGDIPLMQMKVFELLYAVACIDSASDATHSMLYTPKERIRTVKKICRMMLDKHYNGSSIQALVKHEQMHYSVFQKIFKELHGTTPNLYRLEAKMNEAAALLINTDKSLMEIALDMGYENQGKFSAAFKKSIGLLPTQYRRRHTTR